MVEKSSARPDVIENPATAVYPSFAMLAGLQLDVFRAYLNRPAWRYVI
jgi:hypothetical protein